MDIDYIITGEFDELSKLMIPVMKENRFLSDIPNVKAFTWYPVTTEIQAVELDLTQKPTEQEITFLANEYTSLTIGVLDEAGNVVTLISSEGIEVL